MSGSFPRPSLQVRIPKDRIAVLIGTDGKTKAQIEEACKVELKVDSSTGVVDIISREDGDVYSLMVASNIVKAIGRGFSPEKAMKLLDENMTFELISLRDLLGKSRSDIRRIKGRIIGKDGKARRIIEETTGTYVSVYGDTVGIIGDIEHVRIAKKAIMMLIEGRQHSTVYRYLYRMQREEKRRRRTMLWER